MRKETYVNIVDDGKEITFKVKQMPAIKQERWVNRVVALFVGSGGLRDLDVQRLQNSLEGGKYGEILNLLSTLKYEDVEPLYNELLECCEHVPDAGNRNFTVPMSANNADTVISDFKNLYRLRFEALKVNFDFFSGGDSSPTGQDKKTEQIRISKRM